MTQYSVVVQSCKTQVLHFEYFNKRQKAYEWSKNYHINWPNDDITVIMHQFNNRHCIMKGWDK